MRWDDLQVLKLIDELEQSGQMSPAAINEHEGDTFGEHELGIWCSLSLASGGHADGGDLYWGALDQISTGCDQPQSSTNEAPDRIAPTVTFSS